MILFNIVSNLASMAYSISIEKDWVIVIAQNGKSFAKDSKETLTKINSDLRRINLGVSVFAPILAGSIMSFVKISERFNGVVVSALFFSVWNIVSLFAEYSLLTSVYNAVPELKKSSESKNKMSDKYNFVSILYKGWLVYFRQGIFMMPGLVLSILHLTVLSFDSITIGYAKSQNLSETLISMLQALGSVTGLAGTFAFQYLNSQRKVALSLVGLIGSLCQLFCLLGCFWSIWVKQPVFFK